MASVRAFVPKFLQKFDGKLLLRNPSVWSARTHLVVYFVLIFAAVCTAMALLYFKDSRGNQNIEVFTFFLIIIVIIALVFWLIFLLRFNVFKRFGKFSYFDGLVTYLLYFINAGLIMALPFIPATIQSYCANRQFSDSEMVNDVNHINLILARLEFNQIPTKFERRQFIMTADSAKMDSWRQNNVVMSDVPDTMVAYPAVDDGKKSFQYVSSQTIDMYRMEGDSINQLNDSIFFKYDFPTMQFIESDGYYGFYGLNFKNNRDIYHAAKNALNVNRKQLMDSLQFFKAKYADVGRVYNNDFDVYHEEDSRSHHVQIRKKYDLYATSNIISKVIERKVGLLTETFVMFRLWYYLTMYISMLVFCFRHNTKKTFFLSLLGGVVLSIFTALIVSGLQEKAELAFLILLIAYAVVFAICSFVGNIAKRRFFVFGMSINFFLLLIPIIPMVGRIIYMENKKDLVDGSTFDEQYLNYEIFGFIALLLAIQFFGSWMYRRWYALPEE